MPVLDGDLAGEQRATAGIAVVEEVVPPLARERGEAPVIEDEQPRPCEPLDELGVGTVLTGEGELVKEPGDAVVAGGDAEAAGLVAERTGEIGFSRPGGAGDENGLAVPDPLPGGERRSTRERSRLRGALKLRSSMVASKVEPGVALETLVAALFPVGLLSFEEQGEAVIEGKLADVGHGSLLLEGLGHAREPEFVEEVEGGLTEHDVRIPFRLGRGCSSPARGCGRVLRAARACVASHRSPMSTALYIK